MTVYCDMTNDGGGWTRVVNINVSHIHQNTGSVNPATVADGSVGKYSDEVINILSTGYFKLSCSTQTMVYHDEDCSWSSTSSGSGCQNIDSTHYGLSASSPGFTSYAHISHVGCDDYNRGNSWNDSGEIGRAHV